MIIGISGKMDSGKDLVGKIIQCLILNNNKKEEDKISVKKFLFNNEISVINYNEITNWQIKKFADKLKDIICLLIGCTREQLEDRGFKEKELGEEWWYWKYFRKKYDANFELIPYSFYNIEEYENLQLIKLTPRLLLQLLGTQFGRNIIHPNIWVNTLMSEYKPIENYPVIIREKYIKDEYIYPNWIITDMRFSNEFKAVKDRGGITIRVNRYCYESAEDFLVCHPDKEVSKIGININMNENSSLIDFEEPARIHGYIPLHEQHFSETCLDNAKFNYTINSSGTVEELIKKVEKILIKEKIIE